MDKEKKLQQMRNLAFSLSKNLMKENHTIGAILFGSVVTGNIHEKSDVDLAIIYDIDAANMREGKEERRINNIEVQVWRYSINHFIHTFEDEKLRNKPNTWMWASLWVEYMKKGKILADTTGRLSEWREKARKWKWRPSETDPILNQALDNLQASTTYATRPDLFASLLCLRESMTCLAAAHIMKHNLIPSFRPKELWTKLNLLQTKENAVWNLFNFINDTSTINSRRVNQLLKPLSSFIDVEWGKEDRGTRTELENAYGCLRKQDYAGALLSGRYSAYWLGFHIINKQDDKLKAKICNGENHIKMMKKLGPIKPSFYSFYKKLHFVEHWTMKKLKDAHNQTHTVLIS